jgi:hypothetical protein
MRVFIGLVALIAALAATAPSLAQEAAPAPTQKLALKPHRVKGMLLGYGYTVGEYTGEVRTKASATRALVYSSDKSRSVFTVNSPRWSQPLTVRCGGGQSHMTFAWVQFNTQDLKYVCDFEGGPADAAFSLALSEAGLMARLYQPQRAGELTFGGTTLRAETRKTAGAFPVPTGRVMSYKISRDGQEVGALVRGIMQPTFYLPAEGAPERDAAAVMALTLFFFADPDDRSE